MSSVRNQTGSAAVPKTSCVEPPPTSTTAMLAGGVGNVETTPANASRPSSSALSGRTGSRVAAEIASTSSLPFLPCRAGAVTSTSIRAAPSLAASRA